MDVLTSKLISLAAVGLLSLVVGLLPLKISRVWLLSVEIDEKDDEREVAKKKKKRERAEMGLSCLLCFGGGVLLAVAFTHMIPEVVELIEHAQAEGYIRKINLPLGEIIVCAGFFVVYAVEEVVHALFSSHHKTTDVKDVVVDRSSSRPSAGSSVITGDLDAMSWNKKLKATSVSQTNLVGSTASLYSVSSVGDYGTIVDEPVVLPDPPDDVMGIFRRALVLVALSSHSVFEGMAVGLQEKSNDVWLLLAAITTHKVVLSFCLGLELAISGIRMSAVIVQVFMFALVSPLGIAIGIIVTEAEVALGSKVLASAFLQGLAAGTIVYVTFFEILERERAKPGSGLLRLLFVVAGFVLMAVLESFGAHEHGGGADGHEHNVTDFISDNIIHGLAGVHNHSDHEHSDAHR